MLPLTNVVIIGAGGFGREVLQWVRHSTKHGKIEKVKGFIDDNPRALDGFDCGTTILGGVHDYSICGEDRFLCAIGRPALRRLTHEVITRRGGAHMTFVHPFAIVAETAILESGAIICPFALVSANAKIGEGSALYYHSSVDHDVRVGRFCQISGHCDIAGGATLGDEVFVGSHAAILPGIHIGHRAVIGAGAVVTKDVPPDSIVVGVPARPHNANRP